VAQEVFIGALFRPPKRAACRHNRPL
jgi:hypothetical protein